MERKTRFELATPSLARRCSTTEPLPPGPSGHCINTTSHLEQSTEQWSCYTPRLEVGNLSRVRVRLVASVLLILVLHSPAGTSRAAGPPPPPRLSLQALPQLVDVGQD